MSGSVASRVELAESRGHLEVMQTTEQGSTMKITGETAMSTRGCEAGREEHTEGSRHLEDRPTAERGSMTKGIEETGNTTRGGGAGGEEHAEGSRHLDDMKTAEQGSMAKGTEETAMSMTGGGVGRGTRNEAPKFTESDKENFVVYGGDVGLNENKSPLPLGYPRLPLQDITAVLRRPPNSNSDEEEPNSGVRKPFTRSQGLKKKGNVQTTFFSERISSKTVVRGGSSRTASSQIRKKQVTKMTVDNVRNFR